VEQTGYFLSFAAKKESHCYTNSIFISCHTKIFGRLVYKFDYISLLSPKRVIFHEIGISSDFSTESMFIAIGCNLLQVLFVHYLRKTMARGNSS